MLQAGLCVRIFHECQQTLPMQNRALREYAERRGWIVAMQGPRDGFRQGDAASARAINRSRVPPRNRRGAGAAV